MKRRFKTKRKKRLNYKYLLILLFFVYLAFSATYRTFYKIYAKKIDDDKIIKKIVNHNKLNKSNFSFDKITSPEFLLKYTLNIDFYNEVRELNVVKEKESNPLVYVYNTHDTEKYSMEGMNVYNIEPTVKTADYILEENLNDLGIDCIVEQTKIADILKEKSWKYNRSYDASKILLEQRLQNNDFKLIIDLHRDSSPLSKTLFESDGVKYAKVLFVVGLEHDNYNDNLELAKLLNSYIDEIKPGISRGISEKGGEGVNGIYNQNLSSKSVLIELGGQYNKLEEVNNTMPILAQAIFKYMEDLK